MNIDTQEINENVIPKINTSINSLNEAINNVKKIEIPKGFAYEAYLKNMPNNVTKIKNNVNDVKNKLTNTVTKFEEIERKNSQTISNLTSKIEGIGISDLRKTGSTKTASITSNNFWMTDTINKFSQRKYEIADNLNNNIKNKENETGAKSTSIWDSLYNTFVKPGVDFFEKCGAKISEFVTTAIGEISKGIEFFKNGINNLAKAGWNKMCEIKNNIEFAQKCTGAVISAGWNTLTSEILPAVGDFFKSLGASVANIVVGLLKGVCQFVESLVDLLGLVTGAYRLISLIKNAVPALYDIYVKKDYSNIDWNAFLNGYREEIMEDTMSIVAEDYVQNIYDSFFEETAVGQWLDENAWEMCKSDGTITNIAAGVGYVAGIIILTVVTCGAGSMAAGGASAASAATTTSFASTSAAIAAASGIGKGTQESWGKMRDASWEGVERLYEKGKITKEEYDNMYAIKYCTDEEWADVEKDYKSGVISKEKYEKMKEIREMPEDWKTAENYIKGLGFGVANGIWEGIQWYIGGKLAGWAIKGHKVATVATRVGVDTAFNGLDTPFRTAVDAVTYGKTWDEAWEEQGGWQSVVSNIGIGFIGSAGGEVFDAIKLNKASKILDNNEIFDNLDETTTREIKGLLLQEQQSGKIDISIMTKEQLDTLIDSKLLHNAINSIDEILSKESGIEESLAKDIRRSMQKEHGSGKIDIRKMTKQELEEEINKKIILKNYETTIDDFLEYLELDDITIKKIKNNFFDDLDKNIINSIMDKTQIGEKLEIAVHKTMNNKPQIKIDPEHGFQLTMQDIDIDGYCKAKLDEYYFWGEMIEDVTEERKAIEKSLIKELENLNSKGFIDTCDGYFLKELFDSNDTVYIKTIRANDIDNVVETAMKDGLGIESDLTSTAIKNMNSKGGLYGLIDKLKNLEDLNEGDTVVLIKSSYNEPLYGKVKPENIAGFITTDVNGNISIRRTKFDVNWLNPLMIDEEEGLKKSLEYVKNCTNAQYNIDEFRKLGDDIYKDLINSGYHENFAAEYTDTFIKRIVEDRGWQNIGEYKGVKINALTGLNIDHDELIKIFDEQVPASLFQYIDEINLSDLADDSRFGTIISYGNQIEGAASAIMGQRTVKVFDIKNFMFDDDFSGTMVHELAHNLDAHLSNISDTKAWRDAMKNDAMKSGNDIGCTPYATRTFNDVGKADEDFAEAVKLYTKDKELFKNKYSNRYEILKDILDY